MPHNLRKAAEKQPSASFDYQLRGQTLRLLPERAIFWQEKRYLLLSDAHLGKAGHFRKHGAPIPATVHGKDLAVLTDLVTRWQPETLVVLGDLFHSDLNNEWLDFEAWLHQHHALSVVLVKGNHDILPEAVYQHPNLTVHPEAWAVDPFLLTHEPVVEAVQRRGGLTFFKSATAPRLYNLAGHVHPGVRVSAGMGERVKLPCFYFTPQLGILPAFGQFTGCATVHPQSEDQVFAVLSPQRVLPIRQ
ncbi:MAG: ligase-associated DNA damage response endonuclease PdeM [Tunicatimonas sp.]